MDRPYRRRNRVVISVSVELVQVAANKIARLSRPLGLWFTIIDYFARYSLQLLSNASTALNPLAPVPYRIRTGKFSAEEKYLRRVVDPQQDDE